MSSGSTTLGSRRLVLAAAVIIAATFASQREGHADTDTTRYELPEVVIQAVRPATAAGGASAVEVRPESLHTTAAPLLNEVLREVPFLYVRDNSRGEVEISARGSESRQVAILMDGIPLTLAWDARADVSVIPATAPQRLTYVRGLSSMLHGPNVLGGVIEMSVGGADDGSHAHSSYEVRTGIAHTGSWGTSARFVSPFASGGGRWLLRAGAGFRDTRGVPLAQGVTERVDTEDDLRLNTDSEIADGFASLRYEADGGTWWSATGSSFRGERGIAAELGIPDADARFWRYPRVSRTVAVLSGGTGLGNSPFGGCGDLEASVGYDRGRTDIDAFTSPDYDTIDSFEDGKDRTLTVRLLGDQTLGQRSDFRGAFTLADIRHDEFLPDGDARYRQRLWSLGGETDVRLIERGDGTLRNLRLSVGGAWDVGETPEAGGKEPLGRLTEWGGRAGMTAGLGDELTLVHAGVSRRGRFPALRELYSGALDRFAPNPALLPERLITMETGITTDIPGGNLQFAVFHNELHDAVVRIRLPDPDTRFMRVNKNELTATGVELMASRAWGRTSVTADVTLQSVELTDTDTDVTNRPENMPEVLGSVRVHAPLFLQTGGIVEAHYTGEQFVIDPVTGEDAKLDSEIRFDAEIARLWGPRLETSLAMDNVTDVAVYSLAGLPEPGRLVRLQFRFF